VEKMQFIFFVHPNEELEGTWHPQKFGCTPKNEGKMVHVPPDETLIKMIYFFIKFYRVLFTTSVLNLTELVAIRPDLQNLHKILYFHENQLIYPVKKQQERDFSHIMARTS
jgi:hypothetical protein